MEDIYRELGERVRAKRRQLALTLEDLAELSGLPAPYIGQIERGEKKASLRSVARLAQGLGVPAGRLLGEEKTGEDAGIRAQIEASLRGVTPEERELLLTVMRDVAKGLRSLR